jgi:hypothetical protein
MHDEARIEVQIEDPTTWPEVLVHRAVLNGEVPVDELVPPIVRRLKLPITRDGTILAHHLKWAEQRLDSKLSLRAQRVPQGATLVVEVEAPTSTSLLQRLAERGQSGVMWYCQLVGGPCTVRDWTWDPRKVLVAAPESAVKLAVFQHSILPTLDGLGLRASQTQIQASIRASLTAEELATEAQASGPRSLGRLSDGPCCRMCCEARSSLLTIVDLTGRDPTAYLTLGLSWGIGHPVVAIHSGDLGLSGVAARTINYREPGEERFSLELSAAIHGITGIIASVDERCADPFCGRGFTTRELIVACLDCQARYHQEHWQGRCRNCRSTSYICL